MPDHAFFAAVEALRRSFNTAFLDHQIGDERLQSDILCGDLTWEASYALPGEGTPARVRAEITVDWPTWSQTALRSWQIEDDADELPELMIEVSLRVQDLAGAPDLESIRRVLDADGPDLGADGLRLAAPTLEQSFDFELTCTGWAVEFVYEGTHEISEAALRDPSELDPALGGLGPWVASMLVRLGDLRLEFLPHSDQGA